MGEALPSANLLENVRFNATVVVPNAVQGIFRRRRPAVAAATAAGLDGQAVGLLGSLARKHSYRPVWVRLVTDPALLLLDPDDIGRALEHSPDPFASDPEAKRKGMVAFQPDALTISRGDVWAERRRFTEAVLETGSPHGLAERFEAVCVDEVARLLEGPIALNAGELDFDPLHDSVQRITRRVVLGDSAAADQQLSHELEEMMSEANGMPGQPSDRLPGFMERLEAYVDRAEAGSLVAAFSNAPCGDATAPTGQIPHWMFAMGDTLAINLIRTLALLGSHQDELALAGSTGADRVGAYLEACINEAMRLWPTTTMLSRVTLAETEWEGETVPADTQILIVNTFGHRDPAQIPYADRFAPEEWIHGSAAAHPAFNHFSRGPQGCPGSDLALIVGRIVLRELIGSGELELISPGIDPAKPLPHMLDYFGVKVRIA